MIYETCMGDVHDLTGVMGIAVRPIPEQLANALRSGLVLPGGAR